MHFLLNNYSRQWNFFALSFFYFLKKSNITAYNKKQSDTADKFWKWWNKYAVPNLTPSGTILENKMRYFYVKISIRIVYVNTNENGITQSH